MSDSTALDSFPFEAIIFDLDGTLVDSADAVLRFWHELAADLAVDPQTIVQNARGRRTIETVRLHDPSKATWDYVTTIESSLPRDLGSEAREVLGAATLLRQIDTAGVPWAIATSCTRELLFAWLRQLGLPEPVHTVAAQDVEAGKPDPACYLLARQRIGKDAGAPVLVVEDSPTGVRAGKAAGCRVLGVTTNATPETLKEVGADFVVPNFSSLQVRPAEPRGEARVGVWTLTT